MPRPPIRPPHPFSFGWLEPTFKDFILKCYWELNWGENWKSFEFYAIFNHNLKGIVGFRSDIPILGGYDPRIRCSIDSKPLWVLLGVKMICQSIITNCAKCPLYSLTKSWVSAAVDQALKLELLDKLKRLYMLLFFAFFDDWCQMGNLRAFIRPGSL